MCKLSELDLGTRVVFPEGYECFPHYNYKERLEGEVVSLHDHIVVVKLDAVKAELEDFDNSIYAECPDWHDEAVEDPEVPSLEVLNN